MNNLILVNKDKLIDLLTDLYTTTGECYSCPLNLDDKDGICSPNEDCVTAMINYLCAKYY